jgi:hypothetical protein
MWCLYMHNGEHFEQEPRLQPANCPPMTDLAALATDDPPLPGASELAAVAAASMARAREFFSLEPGVGPGELQGQQDVRAAHHALAMCRNPADWSRNLHAEHSLAGENVFVLQQDPWLAAAAAQQQQEALPAVVQGVWPELGMIPHSCAPNTTAPVMHKVRCLLHTYRQV